MTCLRGSVNCFIDLHEIRSIQGFCILFSIEYRSLSNNNSEVGGLRPSPARIVGEWS